MAEFTSFNPGQFSWVDLLSRDAAASARFYGALFGWSFEAAPPPEGAPPDAPSGYGMFASGGKTVAGMGEMDAETKASGRPQMWNSYVTVNDLPAALARAEELGGGVIMPPHEIAPAGAMAIISGPEGEALSLWKPGAHAGAALCNVPVSFCWNELLTRDADAAQEFYGGLFGWQFKQDDPDGYREIILGARAAGGMLPWREEMGAETPANWGVYFAVENCDATVARCQELGGALMAGPVDIEPGRFAVVRDDAGSIFSVMKLTQPDE